MDKSHGYEFIAQSFIERRGGDVNGIGTTCVRNWAQTLPKHSTILDLGCGTGIPICSVLIDEGMKVYGIDASPTMIKSFLQNFPEVTVACEGVEESNFFNLKFDAIISWGLIFLLSKDAQVKVIQKAAEALTAGGKLLFTAPSQKTEWKDAMTGQLSISLGANIYKELLSRSEFFLIEEFEDEGQNHYYNSIKI